MMATSGSEGGVPGAVVDVYSAVESAMRVGLDEFLDDIQEFGSEWWDRLFQQAAMDARGAAWARLTLRLPSNRPGEIVVWLDVLRRRDEPEQAHDNLCLVHGFYRLDVDSEELIES